MKISKKEFINTLATHINGLVAVSPLIADRKKLERGIAELVAADEQGLLMPSRTLAKRSSNRLEFSDGSSLYFSSIGETYREGTLLYNILSWYDEWEQVWKYKTMIYVIGDEVK